MSSPKIVVDRYEVVRPLGRGSFGQTLLARDTALNRPVVLKVLSPHRAEDWKAYELFEREAAVLKDLRHPGIPVMHTALETEWEGRRAAVLVMEYLEGDTLADIISQRRHLEPDDVLHMFVEMLGLLDYLHTRVPPVLHRDIKPANIIVRQASSPSLVDFGAVRNVFRNPDEPGSTMVGTYGYMPYEQTMGQASPSSDLYALGATFLHVLTGRPPTDFMTEDARLEVPAELPCNDRLREILTRMLEPRPADRFRSARDVRTALIGGTALTASPNDSSPAIPLPDLPPTPRSPATSRDLARRARYTTWQLLNANGEPSSGASIVDVALIGFFSVITVGIVPALFLSRALARRRRIKPFMKHGLSAIATVLELSPESIEFEAKLTRVRYAFEADGRRQLGTDRVLPSVADRWELGGQIHVMYLPDRDYESIALSGG